MSAARLTPEQFAACEAEIERKVAEFCDNDWGEHDPKPWFIWHALSAASGMQAIESLRPL